MRLNPSQVAPAWIVVKEVHFSPSELLDQLVADLAYRANSMLEACELLLVLAGKITLSTPGLVKVPRNNQGINSPQGIEGRSITGSIPQ